MSLKELVLDFFFPPRCAFCGAILEKSGDGVCETCRKTLPCTADVKRSCDFVRAYTAPFYYEEPVRQGVLTYKFGNAPARGKVFGRMLGEDLLSRGIDDFREYCFCKNQIDTLSASSQFRCWPIFICMICPAFN